MPQYGWVLDYKRCIECRACEAACKQWNGLETGIRFRQVRVYETGQFPKVQSHALSLACNHCDNPLCLKVCPTKSIFRHAATGAILINQETCVGCELCSEFCPYGALQINTKTRKMSKCTMCVDRLEQNLQPACVTLCPTGALQFGRWEQVQNRGTDRAPNFPNPATTRPSIRFIDPGWPKADGNEEVKS